MNGVEKIHLGPEYLEMDPENYDGAAEEWQQPTSVVEKKGRRIEVHQILRIRAEDLHLREEEHHIGEGNFMLFTRPILPASPLSAKSAYC